MIIALKEKKKSKNLKTRRFSKEIKEKSRRLKARKFSASIMMLSNELKNNATEFVEIEKKVLNLKKNDFDFF